MTQQPRPPEGAASIVGLTEDVAVVPPAAPSVEALIADLVGRDHRILLFGSRAASVTEALAGFGCRIVVVESDSAAAALAAAFAERVVVVDLDSLNYFGELIGDAFDAVVFVDFLEFVGSPQLVLAEAVRLLGSGGTVVAALRNLSHVSVRRALLEGSCPPGLSPPTGRHFGLHTLETARALLEESSLKVEHLARVEMPHSGEAVSLAQDALPPAVEEWLEKAPESQTFQYIFRCQVDPSSARGAPTATTAGNEPDRRDDPVIRLQAQALIDMEGELRQLQDLRSRMDAKIRELNDERAQRDARVQQLIGERGQLRSLIQVYERSPTVKLITVLRRAEMRLRRAMRREPAEGSPESAHRTPPELASARRKRLQPGLVRRLRRDITLATEALRVSGLRAFGYRLRRIASVKLAPSNEIQLPIPMADVLAADWTRPRMAPQFDKRVDGHTITVNWVLPRVSMGSGGHSTIFRIVRHLESKGHTCRLYFFNPLAHVSFREIVDTVRSGFEPMRAEILPFTMDMKPCDALVATGWQTSYPVFNSTLNARKFYFVQDFEPYFYPVSTESVLAANTYRFGLHGIAAGQWLSTKLSQDYGLVCDYFEFGADIADYANQQSSDRRGVVFYARAPTPRRGFPLGVMALELFHKEHPEVDIHLIGRVAGFQLPFPCINHGVLSHEDLNSLYNRCAAGLVISLTNMSLVPLELLATGCIPVVNDASNTRLVGGSRYIQYAEPSPHALAAALSAVVTRRDLKAYARRASASVRTLSWEHAAEKVERILLTEVGAHVA